jgi:FAD-dependent oxidoreductase
MTIEVQPGITMGEVGDALHAVGLALRNTLPFRGFTAGGVIGTAAHHTSIRFPSSVSDHVVALTLVDGTGELVTLTGDEARGASAHLGLLGVLVSITFQAEPQFKTRHTVTGGDDADLESQILEMARSHDYASFSWFPTQGRWVLRQHDIVPVATPGEAYHTGWVSTSSEQRVQAALANATNRDPEGEATQCSIEEVRAADLSLTHDVEGEEAEGEVVGFSHRMFSSFCEGLECPWSHLKIFNPEMVIPAEMLPAWMARVREILAVRPTCFPVNGLVIRFSAPGDGWLAMNHDREVAYIEYHVPRHPEEGRFEHFADGFDEIHQMTLLEFPARLHWGKNYAASFTMLDRSEYPRLDDFLALKARLDPDGLFTNPFFERVLGERSATDTAGCAVDRSCFCTEDRHCGEGRRCTGGSLVESARVCVRTE